VAVLLGQRDLEVAGCQVHRVEDSKAAEGVEDSACERHGEAVRFGDAIEAAVVDAEAELAIGFLDEDDGAAIPRGAGANDAPSEHGGNLGIDVLAFQRGHSV